MNRNPEYADSLPSPEAKEIIGYNGRYLVEPDGRVWSAAQHGKYLSPIGAGWGRIRYGLCHKRVITQFFADDLIEEYFGKNLELNNVCKYK
tara:strand:+ start:629 stop:901 length:273 start_codon:yes stop_codon:yes gene_type:complete